MSTKKVSRAHAKRLLHEELAGRPPAALPAHLAGILSEYRPEGVDGRTWEAVRPHHADVMTRSGFTGEATFTKHLGVVASFLIWRHRQHNDLSTSASFTFAAIDAFYLHGMTDLKAATRNDYRSRLLGLAPKANPALAVPASFEPAGYQHIRPGYTPLEEAALRRSALRQRRPVVRRQLCAIVGLGAGAGLDSQDMRELRNTHFEFGDFIAIHVPGPRPRFTVVREPYEELIRVGLDGLRPGHLVLGKNADRKSVTGKIIENADLFGDTPKIEVSRLRSTWLAVLMQNRVPIQVILGAAGLRSARSLTDLLPHLPPIDAEQITGFLQGVES